MIDPVIRAEQIALRRDLYDAWDKLTQALSRVALGDTDARDREAARQFIDEFNRLRDHWTHKRTTDGRDRP